MSEGMVSPHDAQELEACFRATASDLFGRACAVTRGDQALAHDLVQAAFEAAARSWQALESLTGEQRPGWLYRTLATIAVNGFRRESAFRDRLPLRDVHGEGVETGSDRVVHGHDGTGAPGSRLWLRTPRSPVTIEG